MAKYQRPPARICKLGGNAAQARLLEFRNNSRESVMRLGISVGGLIVILIILWLLFGR